MGLVFQASDPQNSWGVLLVSLQNPTQGYKYPQRRIHQYVVYPIHWRAGKGQSVRAPILSPQHQPQGKLQRNLGNPAVLRELIHKIPFKSHQLGCMRPMNIGIVHLLEGTCILWNSQRPGQKQGLGLVSISSKHVVC